MLFPGYIIPPYNKNALQHECRSQKPPPGRNAGPGATPSLLFTATQFIPRNSSKRLVLMLSPLYG